MNFLAGLLLLVSAFNEFEAFSFFCFIMVHQHLKEFFRERFPLLRKYIRGETQNAFSHWRTLENPQFLQGTISCSKVLASGVMLQMRSDIAVCVDAACLLAAL